MLAEAFDSLNGFGMLVRCGDLIGRHRRAVRRCRSQKLEAARR